MLLTEQRRLIKRVGKVVAISVGGILTFAMLTSPTRVSGATRSARLKWQQHHQEIRAESEIDPKKEMNTLDQNRSVSIVP